VLASEVATEVATEVDAEVTSEVTSEVNWVMRELWKKNFRRRQRLGELYRYKT
jgi:hypothetical protein